MPKPEQSLGDALVKILSQPVKDTSLSGKGLNEGVLRIIIAVVALVILLSVIIAQIVRDTRREAYVRQRLDAAVTAQSVQQDSSGAQQSQGSAIAMRGEQADSRHDHQPLQSLILDDNPFLIQGEVQLVDITLADPVVICCIREQGRTIRLAGVENGIWRQDYVDGFLRDAARESQQYYGGKALFQIISSHYDPFGNLYGYLYIPSEQGVWWHSSYVERFYQVNLQLVRRGYARYVPNDDLVYSDVFREAQHQAQRDKLGMWR